MLPGLGAGGGGPDGVGVEGGDATGALPTTAPPTVAPDREPQLLEQAQVTYPPEAQELEVEGDVELLLTIDEQGHVREAVVLRGPGAGLDEAARRGLRSSRFLPALRGGRPASVTVRYRYRFVLE